MCTSNNCSHNHKVACSVCDKSFTPSKHQIKRIKSNPEYKVVCSDYCKGLKLGKFRDESLKNKKAEDKKEVLHQCSHCFKTFPLSRSQVSKIKKDQKTTVFCSISCSRKQTTKPDILWACSDHECGKEFYLKSFQRNEYYNNGIRTFFCSLNCSHNSRGLKKRHLICQVEGCNHKAEVDEKGEQKNKKRYCAFHRELKNIEDAYNSKIKDLKSLFIIEPLLPDWALNMSSLELSLCREEFMKQYTLNICHDHYIRQEREVFCGIMSNTRRKAVEEDIYLLDLNWMISFKRNENTGSKEGTDSQLENSIDFFTKNRRSRVKSTSVSIDNSVDIADLNCLQFSRDLKARVNRAFKSSRIKLFKGIRAFNNDMDKYISALEKRFKLLKKDQWKEIYSSRIEDVKIVYDKKILELKAKYNRD